MHLVHVQLTHIYYSVIYAVVYRCRNTLSHYKLAVWPASTANSAPDMKLEASDARNKLHVKRDDRRRNLLYVGGNTDLVFVVKHVGGDEARVN